MRRCVLVLFFLLLQIFNSHAQTTFCPPNIGFESGNFSNWILYTGSCCPINTPTSGAVIGRHTIMTGNGTDAYGGFPVVSPGSGNYSLKLGNSNTGAEAERARYYIKVPAGSGKQLLIYRYAVVFENPDHDPADQPRFEVKAYDSATNALLSCNSHTYVASNGLTGFYQSRVNQDVYYRPWTTATINLSGYAGKTVALDFATGDCKLGAHFGYGYVDLNCSFFEIDARQCNASGLMTLDGPPGFEKYKWIDSATKVVIDTLPVINLPIPQVNKTYMLIVTPFYGIGCVDTFYAHYNALTDNINATASNDTAICAGMVAQLDANTNNANGPFSYSWWPTTGLSCPTCKNPVATPTSTQTYQVYIQNGFGCRDTDNVVVTVNPRPVGVAFNDTAICDSGLVTLNATGGTDYKWFPATNIVAPNAANTKANVTTSTVYNVEIKNSFGCVDTQRVSITVNSSPVAYAGSDSVVCRGSSIQLHASGGDSYQWYPQAGISDPASSSPNVTISSRGEYFVIVRNQYGCSDTDAVVFDVFPFKPQPGPNQVMCIGDTVTISASGGHTYAWSLTDQLSASNSSVTLAWPRHTTSYSVAVTDTQCHITETVSVDVVVNPLPTVKIVATEKDCGKNSGMLVASGATKYTWEPMDYLGDPNAGTTSANPPVTTRYFLTAIDEHGCQDTTSAVIKVYNGDGRVFLPDAFTPNGDGVNDCYRALIPGDITRFNLRIFNRWGEMVFEANNIYECWDGTYKGKLAELGTYFYYYRATSSICGEIYKQGDMHLIR